MIPADLEAIEVRHAALIAHAGADLAALIAEVRRLRTEVGGLLDENLDLRSRLALREVRGGERDAIVAYLRGWGARIGGAGEAVGMADEIEAGMHLAPRAGGAR